MHKKENRCLRLGVLGCGMICQAAHFDAALKARNIELYAICDVAEDLLNQMADMYKSKKRYLDYGEMLSDPKVEAVLIGIGDQFHVPCARRALEAGKHVFVEKPLGVSVEECEEIARLAEEKDLIVQVGFMKRFDEGIQFSRKCIREEIGDVFSAKAWYCDGISRYTLTDNVQPYIFTSALSKKPQGNPKENKEHYYLLGHSCHLFDTVRFLLGDIRSVQARLSRKGDVYAWTILADMENDVTAVLDLTVAVRRDWYEGFEVFGTEGSVITKTYNPWLFLSSEAEVYTRKREGYFRPMAADGHFYRRQLEEFADVILHGSRRTGADAWDGAAAMRAMKAVYDSVHSGGKTVFLKDVKGGL